MELCEWRKKVELALWARLLALQTTCNWSCPIRRICQCTELKYYGDSRLKVWNSDFRFRARFWDFQGGFLKISHKVYEISGSAGPLGLMLHYCRRPVIFHGPQQNYTDLHLLVHQYTWQQFVWWPWDSYHSVQTGFHSRLMYSLTDSSKGKIGD